MILSLSNATIALAAACDAWWCLDPAFGEINSAGFHVRSDPGLRQILRTPKRVMEVFDPGETGQRAGESVYRFRWQHNVAPRPGQRRASATIPTSTLDEVKALAA